MMSKAASQYPRDLSITTFDKTFETFLRMNDSIVYRFLPDAGGTFPTYNSQHLLVVQTVTKTEY